MAFEVEPAKAAPVTLAGDAAPRVAPYGSWRSPITAEMVARAALRRGAICTGLFCLLGGGASAGDRANATVRRNAGGTVRDITRLMVYQFGRRIVQSIYCPRLRSGPTLPIHKLGTRLIGDRLHEHFLFCRSFVSTAEFIENSSRIHRLLVRMAPMTTKPPATAS